MKKPYSVTHDFSSDSRILEYDFGMPSIFHVQITGNPEACKIEAEKITEQGTQNGNDGRLIFKNEKDEVVGSFRSMSVVGWWKQF